MDLVHDPRQRHEPAKDGQGAALTEDAGGCEGDVGHDVD